MAPVSSCFPAHDADHRVEVFQSNDIVNIARIISKNNDEELPFYIGELDEVVFKMKLWRQQLPNIRPYYAVKVCHDPLLLKILAAMGAGFDCASKAEIQLVLNDLVDPGEDIIYASPCKLQSHIAYAAKVGVHTSTFESEMELQKIKALDRDAKVILRLRSCRDGKGYPALSKKYGCPMEEYPALLKKALEMDMNVIGVSFHVGFACVEPELFEESIQNCKRVFEMAEAMGIKMSVLDLGGGFPGSNSIQKIKLFQEHCAYIRASVNKHFPTSSGIRVIAEPGQYFAASAFHLAAKVILRKEVPSANISAAEPPTHFYLNDGAFGSFGGDVFKYQDVNITALEKERGPRIPALLWGPTCDSMDVICERCEFPPADVGDWFLFDNMGAYTMPLSTCYNGFPLPEICYSLTPEARQYVQQHKLGHVFLDHVQFIG